VADTVKYASNIGLYVKALFVIIFIMAGFSCRSTEKEYSRNNDSAGLMESDFNLLDQHWFASITMTWSKMSDAFIGLKAMQLKR